MTLRTRIAVIAAVAVAVAVLATSIGVYVATARTLHGQTDAALTRLADEILHARPFPGRGLRPGPRVGSFGGAAGFVQVLDGGGRVLGPLDGGLPVSEKAAAVATSAADRRVLETTMVDGTSIRVLTAPLPSGGALQVALPITETTAALADLRRQLVFVGVAGIAFAGLLGLAVAQRAIRPVHALTEIAEDVSRTRDLTRRLDPQGDDEVGRLARTFNLMLANLEEARAAQRQLVADASHELRTPLTSLRTNIEVLQQADRLSLSSHADLQRDVIAQLDEFGRLVDGLVELTRGAAPARAATPVRLDELVGSVVERLRTFAPPGQPFHVDLVPSTIDGEADRIERAVANLLDNAIKYGAGALVEVSVADGVVVVRDHGPGIDPEHLPRVFDRFYRAPEARGAPGSGLGLSIVEQVARAHGGRVSADNAPGGGLRVCLDLREARPVKAT